MAVRNRRDALAAVVLPFLFLAMSGLARAATIVVNTLDSGTQPFPLCTLEDAVLSANTQMVHGGCPAGSGNFDTIEFIITGTIFPDNTLTINNKSEDLIIQGPALGCSGAGPCGITINGLFKFELIDAEGTLLELDNLTLTKGNGGSKGGGALFAGGSEVGVFNCTFTNNEGFEGGAILGIESLVVVLNDTFTEDVALGGGAIFNGASEVLVTNSTFSFNAAEEGADLLTDIGETLANSSIFANSSSGGNCAGVTDDGYNISDDNSCAFSGTSINNSTTLHLDPLGLHNNGGPTKTIALESGSQAINFVPIANCDDLFFDDPVTNDQRLFTRPDPANLNACDAGAYEVGAVAPIVLAPKSERVQIARSSSSNSDKVNMAFTFTINGDPDCDLDEDALNSGINVSLFGTTCANIPANGLELSLSPFVVHRINGQSYGTLFQSFPPETVSARMSALKTPAGSCGEWTLNLEVGGLNTSALGLGGSNPFALVLTDTDGDRAGCFDISNAIVGNQIPTPGHGVRRGVRR